MEHEVSSVKPALTLTMWQGKEMGSGTLTWLLMSSNHKRLCVCVCKGISIIKNIVMFTHDVVNIAKVNAPCCISL